MPTLLRDKDMAASIWSLRNRGQISKIAARIRPPVSPQFVHLVLHGKRKSRGGKVERMLREAGAPV
jgi:hypothetical protein